MSLRVGGEWLKRAGTQGVLALLSGAGHQAYAVGGCVRNALLGLPVQDVDIATSARPEAVLALAKAAGVKAVPTGFDHGTVTLVWDGIGYEVTSFRADLKTDGRRAEVAFGADLAADAARRDFTMNALYADAAGQVIDPLGALPDLQARRLRFVGDPAARIAEDYLRILRFFRFAAYYGDPGAGMDAEGLAACAAAQEGLARLSAERVGAELMKLLAAPDPAPALGAMAASGILARLLPGAAARAVAPLVHLEGENAVAPEGLRRLAALGPAGDWGQALRLSRADQARLRVWAAALASGEGPGALAYRFGAEAARDALLLRAALIGAPLPEAWAAEVARGAAARCPVKAADLPHLSGPALGARLKALEEAWIASGFALSQAELLAQP